MKKIASFILLTVFVLTNALGMNAQDLRTAIVGQWVMIEMGNEEVPEDGLGTFIFRQDGSGQMSIIISGDLDVKGDDVEIGLSITVPLNWQVNDRIVEMTIYPEDLEIDFYKYVVNGNPSVLDDKDKPSYIKKLKNVVSPITKNLKNDPYDIMQNIDVDDQYLSFDDKNNTHYKYEIIQ